VDCCKCNVGVGVEVREGEEFFSHMFWEKVNLHVYKLFKYICRLSFLVGMGAPT